MRQKSIIDGFLSVVIVIGAVLAVGSIAYHGLGMTHEQAVVATIVIPIFIFTFVATAIFVFTGNTISISISLERDEEGKTFPFLRGLLALGVMLVCIGLVLYNLPIWWHSAGFALAGIGLAALVCFLPCPRWFLRPEQLPGD